MNSKNIVIETACFDPGTVRKSSKKLSLHSESSHRFERGIDIENTFNVNARVFELLTKIAQEQSSPEIISAGILDHYPQKFVAAKIALRPSFIGRIMAIPFLKKEDIAKKLTAIGFKLLDQAEDRLLFEVPSWRQDITMEIDLVEEYGRFFGLDKIPSKKLSGKSNNFKENPLVNYCESVRSSMANSGYTEICSYSFTSEKSLQKMMPSDHVCQNFLRVKNPISDETNILQPTLALNLLTKFQHNLNIGQSSLKLFEVARCFIQPQASDQLKGFWRGFSANNGFFTSKADSETRPLERIVLGGGVDLQSSPSWRPLGGNDFFAVKSQISSFLKQMNSPQPQWNTLEQDSIPWIHPGIGTSIYIDDVCVGYMGQVHPEIALKLSMSKPAILFELDLNAIFKFNNQVNYSGNKFNFPPASRDLGFIVNITVTHKQISECLQNFTKRKHLQSWQLFDIYQGDNIPAGKKSLAYKLNFRSANKTLKDKEVDREMGFIVDEIKAKLGIEFRDS